MIFLLELSCCLVTKGSSLRDFVRKITVWLPQGRPLRDFVCKVIVGLPKGCPSGTLVEDCCWVTKRSSLRDFFGANKTTQNVSSIESALIVACIR